MRHAVDRLLNRFHHEEHGAIALLCLASILILFMCALIMYDASLMIRGKTDVHMAADTAAYSQAAVEARAMNMIAFANIGKRTVVGIHNMYYFQYPAYAIWWISECGSCSYPYISEECFNCVGNLIDTSPIVEATDWAAFLGDDDLEQNLKDLDSFQDDLREHAAFWSAGESMIRGARNGANMVLTYPAPDNDDYGPLPLRRGDKSESCLTPTPLADNPVTVVTLIEWTMNFLDLKNRSTSSPNIASDGPAERVNIGYSFLACPLTTPEDGAPFYNFADSNSSEHMLQRSNYIWTYKHMPNNDGLLRNNYMFLNREYIPPGGVTMPRTGMWSIARSEFHFPPSSKPNTILKAGAHDTWMFHPGWYGKIRPTTLPQEEPPVEHTDMFEEALELGLPLATVLFNIAGVQNFDGAGFANDVLYMRMNVTPGMVGQVPNTEGDDRHITDGMSR